MPTQRARVVKGKRAAGPATFDGTVSAPCYWVRCNTVQEGGNGLWHDGYGPGGITGWAATLALAPTIHARFLCAAQLANDGNHFRDDWGYLNIRAAHSQFLSGGFGGYTTSLYLTNCICDHASAWLESGQSDLVWDPKKDDMGWSGWGRFDNLTTDEKTRRLTKSGQGCGIGWGEGLHHSGGAGRDRSHRTQSESFRRLAFWRNRKPPLSQVREANWDSLIRGRQLHHYCRSGACTLLRITPDEVLPARE